MSRKAYKILTDIDLSRNQLLNVSNIEGPAIDNLSKDLKIHADKGDLRIETSSEEEKGQITLGIDEKTSISINPGATVSVEDNKVTVNGTDSLTLKSSDDNSITLTSKNNTITVDADLIEIGSEEDFINTINERITSKDSTIKNYTQTVNDKLSLTTEDQFSVTAKKTLKVTAGETDKYEGKFDASQSAYLLNIEQTEDKFESTETIDNLKIRNSQEFKGSIFDIDSENISLDAKKISIGTGEPQNTSLKIYGGFSGGFSENVPTFKLDVEDEQSEMTLKNLHTNDLEITDELSLNAEDNNIIKVKKSVDLQTPNLTLGYENGDSNVLTMVTSEKGGTNTSLNTDKATISKELTSNETSNLSGTTTITGTLNVNNELIEGDSTVEGDSLTVDSKTITLGKEKTENLEIKTSEAITEETPSKILNTTKSYTHNVEGTYKVIRSTDFEINASEEETENEAGEIVETTFDSHIRANTLTANNNVQIGEQSDGVNIYWDKASKSLVFTKWE